MAGGDGPMEFMYIIIDFITLGAVGLFSTITLAIWYEFCQIFIFDQGYFSWFNRHKIFKTLLILSSGVIIWGTALLYIHNLLWHLNTSQGGIN